MPCRLFNFADRSLTIANIVAQFAERVSNQCGDSRKLFLIALSAEQKEPIGMCVRELERLKRLISDLLDVSQIEAGKLRLEKKELVLQEVLKPVAQSVSALIHQKDQELVVKLSEAPAVCYGDKDRLSQVFLNLVSNAIKFTDKGAISIVLIQEAETYLVRIADTGRGIGGEDLQRIFEKFERVGAHNAEGSGLGLSIAKAIIELHKGTIWVESEPGKGSSFFVRLPFYHTALALEAAKNGEGVMAAGRLSAHRV